MVDWALFHPFDLVELALRKVDWSHWTSCLLAQSGLDMVDWALFHPFRLVELALRKVDWSR
jgi:hypothetical protein